MFAANSSNAQHLSHAVRPSVEVRSRVGSEVPMPTVEACGAAGLGGGNTGERGCLYEQCGDDEVSVVSWNTWAQSDAKHCRAWLRHLSPKLLAWEFRWNSILSSFRTWRADVLCIQEVEPSRWVDWEASLKELGYASLLQEKNGSDKMLAIFYDDRKLECTWTESRSRTMLASFRMPHAPGAPQVHIINAHLEGHPYRGQDRVAQMKKALHRLERQLGGQELAEAANVIICGDFNSTRSDSVCRLLYHGRLEAGSTEPHLPHMEVTAHTVAHAFALQDAYARSGSALPFSRMVKGGRPVTIDFAWCSRHLQVAAVMAPVSTMAEWNALSIAGGIPNRLYPSDHAPIGAVLRLAPPPPLALPPDQPGPPGNAA